ncbi:MAG: hypothetical protein ACXV79_10730 [Methylobacter sp.]
MDNKNNTAKTQSEPVFKHRFDETQSNDLTHVVDSIGLLTDRAKSVLYLLYGQFEKGAGRYNDSILQGAIDSVIAEIDDIDSILAAHCEAIDKAGVVA